MIDVLGRDIADHDGANPATAQSQLQGIKPSPPRAKCQNDDVIPMRHGTASNEQAVKFN